MPGVPRADPSPIGCLQINFKARRKAVLLDVLGSAAQSIAGGVWSCSGSCRASYCDPYRTIVGVLLKAARHARAGAASGPFAEAYAELEGLACYRRQARDAFEAAERIWRQNEPSFMETY